jgi:hypothetical protein
MPACLVCGEPVLRAQHLTAPRTGEHAHPACAARRLPEDAVVAVLAALALVLVPGALVWAG